jgi:methanogenic corrinoid protein MtbC1
MTAVELHTLRVWERRYGFPVPGRTGGGSRLYSDSDVESLKLIRRALALGYRPNEVVGRPLNELMQLVLATPELRAITPGTPKRVAMPMTITPTVRSLLDAVQRDDVRTVRAELRQAAIVLGPKAFLTDVAHPLCVRVGELWAEGNLEVRHEHILTECVSAQLAVMMAAYEERDDAPRVVLATLSGERHGLGLEMVQVYLAVSQVTPVMIGVDTPAEQVVKAARAHDASAVGVLVTHASDVPSTRKQLQRLVSELPRRVSVWVGGDGGAAFRGDEAFRVHVVGDWCELDDAIAALPGR